MYSRLFFLERLESSWLHRIKETGRGDQSAVKCTSSPGSHVSGRVFSILLPLAAQIWVRPIHAGLCQCYPSQHLNSEKKQSNARKVSCLVANNSVSNDNGPQQGLYEYFNFPLSFYTEKRVLKWNEQNKNANTNHIWMPWLSIPSRGWLSHKVCEGKWSWSKYKKYSHAYFMTI